MRMEHFCQHDESLLLCQIGVEPMPFLASMPPGKFVQALSIS